MDLADLLNLDFSVKVACEGVGLLAVRPADLIVISREVLLTSVPLHAVPPQSLWAARASVLVC